MKVQVDQLRPNPYRRIEKYPINREKVEALKISINETDFWDNILARQVNGGYEIAYGHHRLIALQELGIKEVELPIKKLDNSTMIKIMANENLDDWQTSPAVINETVHAARDYLDSELAKCESWERTDKNIRSLFSSPESYTKTRETGVGRDTIRKFLGENWAHKENAIQTSLRIIKEKTPVDKEAFELLPTMYQAEAFESAVKNEKEAGHTIPKQKQRSIAKVIAKEGTGYRNISSRVHELVLPDIKKKPATYKEPVRPKLDDEGKKILGFIKGLKDRIDSVVSKSHTENNQLLEFMNPTLKKQIITSGNSLIKLLSEICNTSDKQTRQIPKGE
jgi:hypothetical protein